MRSVGIGKQDRANTRRATGHPRVLFVSEDELDLEHTADGMALRGRELAGMLRQSYHVALLTRRRFSTGVADVSLSAPTWEWEPGKEILARPFKRASWMLAGARFMTLGRRYLRTLLAGFQPDLVFLHKFATFHPGVIYELLALPVPMVARFGDCHAGRLAAIVHGIRFSQSVRKTLVPVPRLKDGADRMTLLFNCNFTRDFYTPRFPSLRHRVIYTGVDTARFHPAASPVDSARFVFLGRTDSDKGFIDFCRAMAALPRELVASIDIIGNGSSLEEGLGVLRTAGRSDLLRWVGPSAHEEVASRLRSASILVGPTRDDTLPAAILEAMACGLAVVASDVGGIPEVVQHGRTGLVVPPHDLSRLIEACQLLAENAVLRAALGREARDLVLQRHQASAWLGATHGLVKEMLRGRADDAMTEPRAIMDVGLGDSRA